MVASFLHSLLLHWLDSPRPLDPSTEVVHQGNSPIPTLLCELSDDLVKGTHAACLVRFPKGSKAVPVIILPCAVSVKTEDHVTIPCCFARTGNTVHMCI